VCQHFLLSAAARSLSIATVARMSEQEAETTFLNIRWAETAGKPVCPHCECPTVYECRRPNGAPRWRCKACRADFSVTSGTLFAFHKLPLRTYLTAIVIFCNEVKGKSALALSRDLDVQYKTAFVLAHKMREAMASEIKGAKLGGIGKTAEVDGAYFGGYVKPANHVENRVDRRLAMNQTGKRKVVVVIRERDGRTVPAVFKSEAASVAFIKDRVEKGTTIQADDATSWNRLEGRFPMKRIDHQLAYSADGACTNGAEEFFSRLRRGEIGHHHHIAGAYLGRYAQEAAWREDRRRTSNGDQVRTVSRLAMSNPPSVDFCGYWQRSMQRK
jgi:transposase-like protein